MHKLLAYPAPPFEIVEIPATSVDLQVFRFPHECPLIPQPMPVLSQAAHLLCVVIWDRIHSAARTQT